MWYWNGPSFVRIIDSKLVRALLAETLYSTLACHQQAQCCLQANILPSFTSTCKMFHVKTLLFNIYDEIWPDVAVIWESSSAHRTYPEFYKGVVLAPRQFKLSIYLLFDQLTEIDSQNHWITGPMWQVSTGSRWVPLTKN